MNFFKAKAFAQRSGIALPASPEKDQKTAILLCNLGTPDEPTPIALRRYLAEFLSDSRVVEIPRWIWSFILHGIILRVRPAKSATKYASIWTTDGSPLAVHTQKQIKLLQGFLGEQGIQVLVRGAMRYGNPSIASQLDALMASGVQRVLVWPLYPQYCGATTASTIDAVTAWVQCQRWVPELRFINQYHLDAHYIHALAKSVTDHWKMDGRGQHLIMSFHGMPQRTLELGDPYFHECQATAQQLAKTLRLEDSEYSVCFQSRFGKAKWLQPYTQGRMETLARTGIRTLDVICPGFSSDCLETLEEVNIELRASFLAAGGKSFAYIPCLNERSDWIQAMCAISTRHLHGWIPS